jgi:hypothetical protein
MVVLAVVPIACADDDGAALSTSSSSSSSPTTDQVVVGDLEALAERIDSVHPDPYHAVARADVEARATADPPDPDELLVAAMALANLGVGEGHGGVYPWSQDGAEAWPIHLYAFPDGLRVVGGSAAPTGARLVSVGDTPIEEVVEAVRPLVPHDTTATVDSRLPAYLVFPAVLRGLGFDPTRLTWTLLDGSTAVEPAPATVPGEELRDLLGLFQDQVPPTLPYDRERIFSTERLGDAVHVRWNQVQSNDGASSLSELADALVADVASGAVARVVIDARHNPGGNIGAGLPLEQAVREIEAARPGTVRVIVGRGTFSAASAVLAGVVEELDLVVVGEPSGGSSRSYADPRPFDLPISGIAAYINTRLYVHGAGEWEPIVPDLEVVPTWDDWSAGRDPALEAALA